MISARWRSLSITQQRDELLGVRAWRKLGKVKRKAVVHANVSVWVALTNNNNNNNNNKENTRTFRRD